MLLVTAEERSCDNTADPPTPASVKHPRQEWCSLSVAWGQAGHLYDLLHGFWNVFGRLCLGYPAEQLLTLALALSYLAGRHNEVVGDAFTHHRVLSGKEHWLVNTRH